MSFKEKYFRLREKFDKVSAVRALTPPPISHHTHIHVHITSHTDPRPHPTSHSHFHTSIQPTDQNAALPHASFFALQLPTDNLLHIALFFSHALSSFFFSSLGNSLPPLSISLLLINGRFIPTQYTFITYSRDNVLQLPCDYPAITLRLPWGRPRPDENRKDFFVNEHTIEKDTQQNTPSWTRLNRL